MSGQKKRRGKGKRSRGRKRDQGRRGSGPPVVLMAEYYSLPFRLLHQDLKRTGYDSTTPHQLRQSFWQLVPARRYEGAEARPLLRQYARLVEERLSQVIGGGSVAYWLHVYRRLAPSPVVERDRPITVGITRAVLEAAFQKFGRLDPCGRIDSSIRLGIARILGGLLQSPEFEVERRQVLAQEQWALGDFSVPHLQQLYDAEKLAFEMWRTGAQLRCVGKGAALRVDGSPQRVMDIRSEELEKLVMVFDRRNSEDGGIAATASGTVFDRSTAEAPGMVLLPAYNLAEVVLDDRAHDYTEFFRRAFGLRLAWPWRPNFLWAPFDLRAYYRAHGPLASGFADAHGVSYHSVMAVLASLLSRVLRESMETRGQSLMRLFQRAYEGPYRNEYIEQEVRAFSLAAKGLLGMEDSEWKQVDLRAGADFWKLREGQRSRMDLAYPGPHSVLLPFGNDRASVDYAWIARRLYDFFVGASIPDQNFKGVALEEMVREGSSVLPVKPCVNPEGAERQIDAAFRIGKRLVIVECRAVGRSIGFDRGDPGAIRYRHQVVDTILSDADGKARWLASAPTGRNYDITWAEAIIPVGVTPFVEFMPSLATPYWLAYGLPRVLTPRELRTALDDGSMASVIQNLVPVLPSRQSPP